ncbi:MAG: hypothetical protein WCL00_05500 [Bacteroidota bacterium]
MIQFIASAEYTYESSKKILSNATTVYPAYSTDLNSIRFNIGIGFQKKVKRY